MISLVLLDHPWLTTAALLTFLVAGPPLALWLGARRRLALGLAVVSLLPVALVTLSSRPRAMTVGCAVEGSLVPSLDAVEPMANVVLFVLPALLLTAATRSPLLSVVAGSALSAAIELTQACLPHLGRSCSTGDWLANSQGALVGAALAAVAVLLRSGPSSGASTGTPTRSTAALRGRPSGTPRPR